MKRKKIIFLFCGVLTTCTLFASDLVIAGFESPAADIARETGWGYNGGEWYHWNETSLFTGYGLMDNPSRNDINTSMKVFGAACVANADWWGNFSYIRMKNTMTDPVDVNSGVLITEENKYLKIMVWRQGQQTDFRISVLANEDFTNSDSDYRDLITSKVRQDGIWVDVVCDLSPIMGKHLRTIKITNSCNWDTPRPIFGALTYLYDEVVLSDNPLPRCLTVSANPITLDVSTTYQTIEGFAASDGWNAEPIGKFWNTTTKENIAKWLFSNQTDENGNPVGIGLSGWRMNLGAGSREKGSNSGVNDPDKRTECFLDWQKSGNYDWTKQAGQQWFLEKAKEYGVSQLVLFANSPPVAITSNGKAVYGKLGLPLETTYAVNTDAGYTAYANFIATVLKHFKEEKGIEFSYISPVNETQNYWNQSNPSQEGAYCSNKNLKSLIPRINSALSTANLDTKIMVSEASWWTCLTAPFISTGDHLNYLFNSNTDGDIRGLSNMPYEICAHSYQNDLKNNNIYTVRKAAFDKAQSYTTPVKLHQTEWSSLSNNDVNGNCDGLPSYDYCTYTDLALLLAKVMYADLNYAQVSSWSYWTALDRERWGHKNRFYLIRLKPFNQDRTGFDDNGAVYDNDGEAEANKNLWVMGNYSRFVKPNYKRIALNGLEGIEGSEMNDLFGTAYVSPNQHEVVAVLVNMAYENKTTSCSVQNLIEYKEVASVEGYVTDLVNNLKKVEINPSFIQIPARSVQTIVFKTRDAVSTGGTVKQAENNPVVIVKDGEIQINGLTMSSNVLVYDALGKISFQAKASANEMFIPKSTNSTFAIVKIINGDKVHAVKVILKK